MCRNASGNFGTWNEGTFAYRIKSTSLKRTKPSYRGYSAREHSKGAFLNTLAMRNRWRKSSKITESALAHSPLCSGDRRVSSYNLCEGQSLSPIPAFKRPTWTLRGVQPSKSTPSKLIHGQLTSMLKESRQSGLKG